MAYYNTSVAGSSTSPARNRLKQLTQKNLGNIQQEANAMKAEVGGFLGKVPAAVMQEAGRNSGSILYDWSGSNAAAPTVDTMASPFTGEMVSTGNPFGNTAASIFSDTSTAVGSEAMAQGGQAVAEAGTEAAVDSASGLGAGAAGLAGTGARIAGKEGLEALGVDAKTAGIAAELAGAGTAAAVGGPIGLGMYAGGRLLTRGIF